MVTIHDLKAAYEKAIGHPTSNSALYHLLARHGWRKPMPRPFHPKRDIAARNAFKKTAFQTLCGQPSGLPPDAATVWRSCSPMKRASAASTGHGRAGPPLARGPGSRRGSFAHTSICTARSLAKDGTCVYLIMPASHTACFRAFLDALPRKFARQDILLVQDGAQPIALQHDPIQKVCDKTKRQRP